MNISLTNKKKVINSNVLSTILARKELEDHLLIGTLVVEKNLWQNLWLKSKSVGGRVSEKLLELSEKLQELINEINWAELSNASIWIEDNITFPSVRDENHLEFEARGREKSILNELKMSLDE